jgi:plastocyanin
MNNGLTVATERTVRRLQKRYRPLLAAAGAALLAWSTFCTSSVAQAADPAQIVVKNFMFQPTSVTVKAGSTVTWTNMDEEPHTVVSSSGLFRSSALDTKDSFSFKFDKAGTYTFVCSIHPQMVGTIIVQ